MTIALDSLQSLCSRLQRFDDTNSAPPPPDGSETAAAEADGSGEATPASGATFPPAPDPSAPNPGSRPQEPDGGVPTSAAPCEEASDSEVGASSPDFDPKQGMPAWMWRAG